MKPLQSYHYIWLGAHPERDEVWLRERLKDGFDIHHLDGNHENNDPKNLVMIEAADHLMLHNNGTRVSRVANFKRAHKQRRIQKKRQTAVIGKVAYEKRLHTMEPWRCIAQFCRCPESKAKRLAEAYAFEHALEWPINPAKPGPRYRKKTGSGFGGLTNGDARNG